MSERIITNELIDSLKMYLYDEERSENTREKYMRDIYFFCGWLGNESIDKSVIVEYKKELCGRYAVKSVNSMLSSLNAFFVFMGWHDLKIRTLKIQRQIFADKLKELAIPLMEQKFTPTADSLKATSNGKMNKNTRIINFLTMMRTSGNYSV